MTEEFKFPSVTIGIVHSREGHTVFDPSITWFEKALRSANKQLYPEDINVITIDNLERARTIGSCYNEIIDKSTDDWVFFLGDDDFIKPEYILTLMAWVSEMCINNPSLTDNIIHVTSFCTAFMPYNNKLIEKPIQRLPQGAWKRSYLLANRFDETLLKYVDTDLYERATKDEEAILSTANWHYGYYYRQHPDNVSGSIISVEEIEGELLIKENKQP
jgi:hypothetical protein